MTWHVVRLGDVPASKWRNGGGETRELLAWPLSASGLAADWDLRLSVAEVTASGPFSRFDGVDRWFAVLQGEGVCLSMDGLALDVLPHSAPFRFDGGVDVACRLLGGVTQDFNLMLRRGRGQALMQRVTQMLKRTTGPAGTVVATYASAAPAEVRLGDEAVLHVPAHCLAWRVLEAPATVQVQAVDALWMEMAL